MYFLISLRIYPVQWINCIQTRYWMLIIPNIFPLYCGRHSDRITVRTGTQEVNSWQQLGGSVCLTSSLTLECPSRDHEHLSQQQQDEYISLSYQIMMTWWTMDVIFSSYRTMYKSDLMHSVTFMIRQNLRHVWRPLHNKHIHVMSMVYVMYVS